MNNNNLNKDIGNFVPDILANLSKDSIEECVRIAKPKLGKVKKHLLKSDFETDLNEINSRKTFTEILENLEI